MSFSSWPGASQLQTSGIASPLKTSRDMRALPYGFILSIQNFSNPAYDTQVDLSGYSYTDPIQDNIVWDWGAQDGWTLIQSFPVIRLARGKWDIAAHDRIEGSGIDLWRIPGFIPGLQDDGSYHYCGALNEKSKIWGPTWGTVCQYGAASFWSDVRESGVNIWTPGSIADWPPGTVDNPTPPLTFDEYIAMQFALRPTGYSFECLSTYIDSFEFGVDAIGSTLAYPWSQMAVAQFWPGLRPKDFPWYPLPTGPSTKDAGSDTTDAGTNTDLA